MSDTTKNVIAKLYNFSTSINRKCRDTKTSELQKNFDKITEKLERLSIEHRAMKFEKRDSEKRLKLLEIGKKESKDNE